MFMIIFPDHFCLIFKTVLGWSPKTTLVLMFMMIFPDHFCFKKKKTILGWSFKTILVLFMMSFPDHFHLILKTVFRGTTLPLVFEAIFKTFFPEGYHSTTSLRSLPCPKYSATCQTGSNQVFHSPLYLPAPVADLTCRQTCCTQSSIVSWVLSAWPG